ncbi:hypothetical protein BDN71DRAFT_1176109 [Pleurotus eryngii]|uniref:Uncharacterized protein n=1 Tax=Pleurotus eryngii TaxID=5323 RepID=A0A9P5ZS19_PLEER|nr:hypothetical protein BDN71DRAFT_1176109 [Pleurotus eryngii]
MSGTLGPGHTLERIRVVVPHPHLCRCVRYEACSTVDLNDLVNLRHLRFRISVDDGVFPASSAPAFGRLLLRIPTSRFGSFSVHFICNTELEDLGEAGWGRMAASLEPFLKVSKPLNRVTLVVEDRYMYGGGPTAVSVIGNHLKYIKWFLLIFMKVV